MYTYHIWHQSCSVQGYVAIFDQLGVFAVFFTLRLFGIFTPLTLKLELVPFFSSHSLAEIQDGRQEIQFFDISLHTF